MKFSDFKSEFELFLFSDLLLANRDILKAANSFVLTLQKEVSNNPSSHPELHRFLRQVIKLSIVHS